MPCFVTQLCTSPKMHSSVRTHLASVFTKARIFVSSTKPMVKCPGTFCKREYSVVMYKINNIGERGDPWEISASIE